jgi:hypothetical protein
MAFAGTATAPGVIPLRVGGVSIARAIAAGDTATAAAAKALATMQATPSLAVAGSSGTLTLTAVNKGTLGNAIPISMAYYGACGGEAMPPGLTYTITAMSDGRGDPDLSRLAAAIAAMDFDFIVSPWTLAAELAATTAMMYDTAGRWSYKAAHRPQPVPVPLSKPKGARPRRVGTDVAPADRQDPPHLWRTVGMRGEEGIVDTQAVSSLISELASVPISSVDQLAGVDWFTCWSVIQVFLDTMNMAAPWKWAHSPPCLVAQASLEMVKASLSCQSNTLRTMVGSQTADHP